MMCPGDEGEALAGHPKDPLYPRNVSYSLNSYIRRDNFPDTSRSPLPTLGVQISSVKENAQRIMIYEEMAPNDSWCIMGESPDDIPSARHSFNMSDAYRNNPGSFEYKTKGRGNFCFFDGHVEALSPRQIQPPNGKGNPTNQGGDVGSERYHFPLVPGDPTAW